MRSRLWSWLLPEDSGDRHQFALLVGWILLAGGVIGIAGLLEAYRRHWLSGFGFLVALPILFVLLFLVGRLAWVVIVGGSHAFAKTVLAGGNLAPGESTSAEESLIARGRLEEARASFEARLSQSPESAELRIRLAELHQERGDPEQAVRLLQEVRAVAPDGRYETLVCNLLIDLFERLGDRGRLMTEYARFAANHPGTGAAAAAKRRLAELKAEIDGSRTE